MKMLFRLPLFISIICTICVDLSFGELRESHLYRSYELIDGRTTACPGVLRLRKNSTNSDTTERGSISSSSIIVDDYICRGPGSKKIRHRNSLLRDGVQLPSLVRNKYARFIVGVESATRKCGDWAFNASTVSWFVTSTRPYQDTVTGIKIYPNRLRLFYTHFVTLCMYESSLSSIEQEDIAQIDSLWRSLLCEYQHLGKK